MGEISFGAGAETGMGGRLGKLAAFLMDAGILAALRKGASDASDGKLDSLRICLHLGGLGAQVPLRSDLFGADSLVKEGGAAAKARYCGRSRGSPGMMTR